MNLRELLFLKASGGGESYIEQTAIGNPIAFTANVEKPLNKVIIPLSYTQAGSGNPSPSNARAISGVSGLYVVQSGKNMATLRGYSAANKGYNDNGALSNNYGTTINTTDPESSVVITQSQASSQYAVSNYRNGYVSIRTDNMKDGTRYDISVKITNITSNPLNASLYDLFMIPANGSGGIPTEVKDNVVIWKDMQYKEAANYRQAWEFRNCGMSCTLSEFMVTPSQTNDGEFEAYSGDKLNITLPSGMVCYGGELDVVSGELTLTHMAYTGTWANGTNASVIGSTERREFALPFTCIDATAAVNGVCNVAPWDYDASDDSVHFYNDKDKSYVFLPTSTSESTSIQIVGKLAEPVIVQTTGNALNASAGVNTIWSDVLNNITVKYLNKG